MLENGYNREQLKSSTIDWQNLNFNWKKYLEKLWIKVSIVFEIFILGVNKN